MLDQQYLIGLIAESLGGLSDHVALAKMFPYYVTVHYILVALALRARPGAREFAAIHPLTSCCVFVTACNGGKILMLFVLGDRLIQVFESASNVWLPVVIWYLIMFAPFDALHTVMKFKGVKALLLVLKEVHRVRQIQNGVHIALQSCSGTWAPAIIIGCLCGSGATFLLRPLDHFARGEVVSGHELISPLFSTKTSLVTSVLLVMRVNALVPSSEPMLMLLIVGFAAGFQLLFLFTKSPDPTKYLENAMCAILFSSTDHVTEKKPAEVKQKAE